MSTLASSAIRRVAVYGAGIMGSGIAQVAAAAGFQVSLVDVDNGALQKAQERIRRSLLGAGRKNDGSSDSRAEQVSSVLTRIESSTDAVGAARTADLVIECIIENLAYKHKLLGTIESHVRAHTILATNTSSLSVSLIAAGLSDTQQRGQVAGLHFFNPVASMRLVEIVGTPETKTQVLDQLKLFCGDLGKTSVACQDTPGFIVNRLLVPYIMQAIRMLENGVATCRDIDTAMKLGAGYPMGPFELADFVGLDTLSYIISGWHSSPSGGELQGNQLVAPSKLLDDLVKQGKLGKKSGSGFYEYTKKIPNSN